MPDLETKIREILKNKRVINESMMDQDGSGVNPPGHPMPTWDDVGPAPTHPMDPLPDYTKTIRPGQAGLPQMHPSNASPVTNLEDPQAKFMPNEPRSEETQVSEDTGADEENERNRGKQPEGDHQMHVKGQKGDEDGAEPKYDEKTHQFKEDSNPADPDDDDDEDENGDDKKDMAEDVAALFAGESKLTEAFKKKATTIYEAAITARVKTIVARKIAELQEQYESDVTAIKEELSNKVDNYLSFVVESWVEENRPALTQSIKSSLVEEFIVGLKELFTEHYIDIPEEKVDVLESLVDKVEEYEKILNNQLQQNSSLKESYKKLERINIINESAKDLTKSQADKLMQLTESLEFKDAATFKESVQILKESNLTKTSVLKHNLTEEATNATLDFPKQHDNEMNRIVDVLRKLKT